MTEEELRQELTDRLVSPDLAEKSNDELIALKQDVDTYEVQHTLIWEGLTTKEKLLEDIQKVIVQYQEQIEEMKKMGYSWWDPVVLCRRVCERLQQFEERVQSMDLPALTEDFCGYTYEITNSTVVLRLTHFEWDDAECGRGKEESILEFPFAPYHISEHGYKMEGEYELYN